MTVEIVKNRNREAPAFANINLLGKCNAQCFFCLGKDISEYIDVQDQTRTHFLDWPNFHTFLARCAEKGIDKLYVTGQNTDSLIYKHLDELVDYLHEAGFSVGLRTNGYLASRNMETINKCENSTGYSIHTLNPETNFKIMGRRDLPDWDKILSETKNPRVAIVINRYNAGEFWDILWYLRNFKNIKYVQARRISTDTRFDQFAKDIEIYERLFADVKSKPNAARYIGDFYCAQQYAIYGLQVNFWRTVETSVNSFNYFTDGTLSEEYFIVEGYLKNRRIA
jgi:molybdenum cofactor biosynthesis enzyme MoaA